MTPLQVVMAEDSSDDLHLVELELKRAGLHATVHQVESAAQLNQALTRRCDLVLTDCSMPHLRARAVIETVKGVMPWLPVIVVSGSIGEEEAVSLLKAGASDFISKLNLSRLAPAIERELSDAQARRERADALLALQAAVRARDEFLALAAHELKTPVTALKLQLGMLRRVRLSDEASPRVDDALKVAERINRLVTRLLDVSDLMGSAPVLSREPLPLGAFLRERVALQAEDAARAGSRIEVTADAVRVEGDRRWLSVAIDDLVANAVKFGEGSAIHLTARRSGAMAVIEVADRGRGIHAEDHARIFERFERAVPSAQFGGFGLGLWIARRVFEAHGGSLQVRSQPRLGSTFTGELPAA